MCRLLPETAPPLFRSRSPPGGGDAAGAAPLVRHPHCAPVGALHPRQAISLPPICAREGVAEMVVWPLFGKCDPLQRAQVQCQGGHAIFDPIGDGLPRQILPDGARSMLYTWGKVLIGHSAPAC